MKISTGLKLPQKVYQIRFIQLWNFMLSWVEHEKSFISTGPGLVWERVKMHFKMSSAICLSLDQSNFPVAKGVGPDQSLQTDILATFQRCINSLPHNSYIERPWNRSLLKTLWEKEKMLVTSIFSFSRNVFYPSQKEISVFKVHLFCCLLML